MRGGVSILLRSLGRTSMYVRFEPISDIQAGRRMSGRFAGAASRPAQTELSPKGCMLQRSSRFADIGNKAQRACGYSAKG